MPGTFFIKDYGRVSGMPLYPSYPPPKPLLFINDTVLTKKIRRKLRNSINYPLTLKKFNLIPKNRQKPT